MMTSNNKAVEREEIEALLPWHAAGTLSRRDALKVEQALANDAALARQYATVQEDLVATIGLNEGLGAPSARAMAKLMADIEADASTAQRARASFNFGGWLSDKLSSFSPRTLAWSATAAALAVVLQAGLLAGMFVSDHQGRLYDTASFPTEHVANGAGTYAMISFAPQATAGEITKLLETYNISLVEGPNGGVYKVRLAVTSLPKEEVAKVLKRLQDESSVRFVGPTSAD
jgi:hypothetical protein